MRTTVTIDDRLLAAIKRKAADRNVSTKLIFDEALRCGLEAMESRPQPREYRTPVVSLQIRPGLDSDKLGQISEEIADREAVQGSGDPS
jgi:hypothetical protein